MNIPLQQLIPGFKTVGFFDGPYPVQVHKALDAAYTDTDSEGYFVTVGLKFTESDALNLGRPGYSGLSKTEAMRKAESLAAKIGPAAEVSNRAAAAAVGGGINERITAQLQRRRLESMISRYCCEFAAV